MSQGEKEEKALLDSSEVLKLVGDEGVAVSPEI